MINMKRILLVGKFNGIVQDNHFFDNLFDAQICVDNVVMVKGMLKIKKPELVVISLNGISEEAKEIFEELKQNYPKMPVICLGTNQEVELHMSSICTKQFITLITPLDDKKILDAICNILDSREDVQQSVETKGEKKSILLVDDSNVQLRALNELLKEKYEVRMSTSGMQALTMIGKKKPDMIFLDYEMPICDGKMTLEMIRGMEESKDIPVVFLTGVSDKEHIAAVLDLKPAGYLLKPADAERIYSIIEKVLG